MAMKILTFSSLYPNSANPSFGIFVENRLRELLKTTEIEAVVVAPLPYFFNLVYKDIRDVEREEVRHGIKVLHPRFLNIPKIGMNIAPLLMAVSVLPTILKLRKNGYRFDAIDAHYFYPDGVAAALLSKWLKIPLVITARGTDLNLIADYWIPKKWIKWATNKASHLITVSTALKNRLLALDAPSEKISVLRNGVDLELFRPPEDKEALRARLNVSGKTLISVGNLVALKGHDLIIEAIKDIPDFSLVIVGGGPEDKKLKLLVEKYQMKNRVRFIERQTQTNLKDWYGAADILVLASSREGWPNVILEALACGIPVVATAVGGSPEIIGEVTVGGLCRREPSALREAILQMDKAECFSESCRDHAKQYSWESTSLGQRNIFESIKQSKHDLKNPR